MKAVVRAYDLGGFGDVAGAMRVASHLHRTGSPVQIRAKTDSTMDKLSILRPDVGYEFNGANGKSSNGSIEVDVAGHYQDDRLPSNKDVPHHFTEDMDNPGDRRAVVPVYLKSGLQTHNVAIPNQFSDHAGSPMFYRPFREWDLPNSGERDARGQIFSALDPKSKKFKGLFNAFSGTKRLEDFLGSIDKFGFAHFSPYLFAHSSDVLFHHPYFQTIDAAARNFDQTYGVGLFLNGENEKKITVEALGRGWGVASSLGEVFNYSHVHPNLIFLGSQPQVTTSGLFLSSDIPNLVTGDLSLSDALYGLIAMDGPGFFYETPDWKVPTLLELRRIIGQQEHYTSQLFMCGSNLIPRNISKEQLDVVGEYLGEMVHLFGDDQFADRFTYDMREAMRAEIRRRFGDVQVEGSTDGDFRIAPGAPYLFQDATANIVETLRDDPDTLSETNEVRKMIADGVPVTINVETGVLEPTPKTSNLKDLFYDYKTGYSDSSNLYSSNKNWGLENKTYKKESYLNKNGGGSLESLISNYGVMKKENNNFKEGFNKNYFNY